MTAHSTVPFLQKLKEPQTPQKKCKQEAEDRPADFLWTVSLCQSPWEHLQAVISFLLSSFTPIHSHSDVIVGASSSWGTRIDGELKKSTCCWFESVQLELWQRSTARWRVVTFRSCFHHFKLINTLNLWTLMFDTECPVMVLSLWASFCVCYGLCVYLFSCFSDLCSGSILVSLELRFPYLSESSLFIFLILYFLLFMFISFVSSLCQPLLCVLLFFQSPRSRTCVCLFSLCSVSLCL